MEEINKQKNTEEMPKAEKKFGLVIEQWKVIWEFAKIFIIATIIVLPIRYFYNWILH